MNILHITNHSKDVTGRIAYELHRGFKKIGHNSHILFKCNAGNYADDNIAQIRAGFSYLHNKLRKKAKQLIRISDKIRSNPDYHFYAQRESRTLFSSKKILKQVPFKPDIIIPYWVTGTVNSKNIYELSMLTGATILWYLMDMAALTGGCHYAWDCEGYKKCCGNCPAIYSSNKNDVSHKNLKRKYHFLSRTNLIAIAPTEWLYKQAKESFLFRDKGIYKIMLARPPEIFRPSDKKLARNKLGIPLDKKVVFFGATSFAPKRKGIDYLLTALQHLKKLLSSSNKQNNLLLLIAGNHNDDLFAQFPFDYKYVGMFSSGQELASAYQAADVFLCPSIEDSGPLMINESIMCGTPVVSFDMGVTPDLVHNDKTGYKAGLKDSEDLARGIFNILSLGDAEYSQMCKNCRELGLNLYSPSVQLQSFERVFKSEITEPLQANNVL